MRPPRYPRRLGGVSVDERPARPPHAGYPGALGATPGAFALGGQPQGRGGGRRVIRAAPAASPRARGGGVQAMSRASRPGGCGPPRRSKAMSPTLVRPRPRPFRYTGMRSGEGEARPPVGGLAGGPGRGLAPMPRPEALDPGSCTGIGAARAHAPRTGNASPLIPRPGLPTPGERVAHDVECRVRHADGPARRGRAEPRRPRGGESDLPAGAAQGAAALEGRVGCERPRVSCDGGSAGLTRRRRCRWRTPAPGGRGTTGAAA
jgi:hypothetical protein